MDRCAAVLQGVCSRHAVWSGITAAVKCPLCEHATNIFWKSIFIDKPTWIPVLLQWKVAVSKEYTICAFCNFRQEGRNAKPVKTTKPTTVTWAIYRDYPRA